MNKDKHIPNDYLNFKNINFKVKIETHLGDADKNVIDLDVPPSATSFDKPTIITDEQGEFLEYVANTIMILRTKMRVKIGKSNVNKTLYKNNCTLSKNEVFSEEDECVTISVELLKSKDKIQIHVKEEPYDVETVLDGTTNNGAIKQCNKEEIQMQSNPHNDEKVKLGGMPNVEINNEEDVLGKPKNFIQEELNRAFEVDDGNNNIFLNTIDEIDYDYDGIDKFGNNGSNSEKSDEENSVETSLESYGANKDLDDGYDDIRNSRSKKSWSISKSDDENSLQNFIKEQGFHIDKAELIENINNERNESTDEENSITSSFARELLEEDIQMCKQSHLAKKFIMKSKPPRVIKKATLPRHCEKCNKTFRRPGRLRKHLEVHKKKQSQLYKCKICPGIFTGEQVHEHKIYRIRPEEADTIEPLQDIERRFECTMCGKKFTRRTFLDSHLHIHLNIKNFSCEQCSRTFYSKASLQRHRHKHSGVKCRFCNEMFKAGSVLETHERTHTGEKPFVCELCGKAFALLYGLQYHIRRHNNDKPFECDICEKKFYTNSNLRKHSKTHGIN